MGVTLIRQICEAAMQVSHRSETPQEEGLSHDRVGDAQLGVLTSVPSEWACSR